MIETVIRLIAPVIDGIVYRIRGGGFVSWGDTAVRSLWSVTFSLSYFALSFSLFASLSLILPMFAAIAFVPHAFAMNMGRGAMSPSLNPMAKRWPLAWYKQYTQVEWDALSQTKKTIYDFLGMACVGLIRGLIVYSISTILYMAVFSAIHLGFLFTSPFTLLGAGLGVLAITILQPVSYLVGWYIPWTLPSLKGKSTEWCELLNGIGWYVSILLVSLFPVPVVSFIQHILSFLGL